MASFSSFSRQFLVVAVLVVMAHSFVPSPSIRQSACGQLKNKVRSQGKTIISSTTGIIPEGLVKTITKPGSGERANLGDIATVKYSCYVPDGKPFAKATKQKMVVGDGTMIPGWDKALRSMSVGERAVIRITDPELAYGTAGIPTLVPPNSPIELDVELLDVQPPTLNIDFDSIANADNTPRTASDIAAAYEQRLQKRALEGPAKEGLEGFIEKAKNFYFFGFFEGETGQQAPWFLRPSITFPLAFLIVGAAFYVSFIAGAISERGASSVDELDEIILSGNLVLNTLFDGM
ncbi:FKBP-type peptidyl-prolyl cis-trans isomerase [Nitzschia inconspicua]|uniref:peptidylprolyl isomerase n=1 Tax=Nitzschia inconspicua TaxID=303405 RepID=A0A9K3L4N6_9STRA|nr:FKBP-type peptidyl-prolyl cis-trans isomerase [Nitzschia inconspicua]